MPSYIAIPAVVMTSVVLGVLALGPSIWLTRSERALALRRVAIRRLISCWIAAVVPWIAVLLYLHFVPHFSISVHGVVSLIVTLGSALALFVVLASLPLTVIVLSIIRLLDRKVAMSDV